MLVSSASRLMASVTLEVGIFDELMDSGLVKYDIKSVNM